MLTVAIAVGAVVGLIRARPARYGAPRAVVVVFAAAGVQLASVSVSGTVHSVLLAASVVLGALWLLLQRRHLASTLLRCGAFLNFVVIAANGGMPVDSGALAVVGRRGVDVAQGFLYKHVAMTGHTRLAWLADWIPVPIQRNVVSVGDVLMAIAIGLWVADSVGSWRAARRLAGAVHGEHGRGPRGERVGLGKTTNASENRVGGLASSESAVHLDS